MIEVLKTYIYKDHLPGLSSKIDAVCPLNKFSDKPHWSSDCIDADKVYRIQKFVQRVVEETGVQIHSQIVNFFQTKDKIFPYNIQLIKIDKKKFNTDICIDGQICQTITPLVENSNTYILHNNNGDIEIADLVIGDYAIASYWTEFKDPRYKQWIIGKYLKYYANQ